VSARLALTRVLGAPREVDLTVTDWQAAAVLAAMRTASNDPDRDPEHDRGGLGNMLNDLQGAIGEIRLIRGLERGLGGLQVSHYLFDRAGGKAQGVSDATDAVVALPGGTVPVRRHGSGDVTGRLRRPGCVLRLEAKSHLELDEALRGRLDTPTKRDFAVNCDAVMGSATLNAVGLVPILAAPGRATSLFGRLILLVDVLGWDVVDYGYGDPAFRVDLASLAPRAWDRPWETARRLVADSPIVLDVDELLAIYRGAMRRIDKLHRILPLDHSPREAIASLAAEADRCAAAAP
jgi:hypothetical protein